MDPWKYWTVTHRDHDIMNPVDPGDLDEVLDLAAIPRGARVLDVGCGKGALLRRLRDRGAASGIGVDLSADMAADARRNLDVDKAGGDFRILEEDGAAFRADPGSFDLAACLGASWIFGGHRGTLRALAGWTRPGGIVLVAEPFWTRAPSAEYLAALDLKADSFGSHAGNALGGVAEGLLLLHARVAPGSAWDRYEGLQWRAAEEWARENPGDPDREEILGRMRGWRDVYLREGREVLGDALYLFRKPSASTAAP